MLPQEGEGEAKRKSSFGTNLPKPLNDQLEDETAEDLKANAQNKANNGFSFPEGGWVC